MDIQKSQQMINGTLQQLKLISKDDQELKTIVRQFIEIQIKKYRLWRILETTVLIYE